MVTAQQYHITNPVLARSSVQLAMQSSKSRAQRNTVRFSPTAAERARAFARQLLLIMLLGPIWVFMTTEVVVARMAGLWAGLAQVWGAA